MGNAHTPAALRGVSAAKMFVMDLATQASNGNAGSPNLGMRKAAGAIVDITRYTRTGRDKGFSGSQLLRVADPSHALQALLPVAVAGPLTALKRGNYANSGVSRDQIAAAEERFIQALTQAGDRVAVDVHKGLPLHLLPASDMAVYFLASVYATMMRNIAAIYGMPTIKAVLPETVYNTRAQVYTDFLEQDRVALSEPMASTGGGLGASGHVERTQWVGPLSPFRNTWRVEQADIDFHAEMQGREGAPGWGLLDRSINIAMSALLVTESKLIAFGQAPGTVYSGVSANLMIPGFLYMATPTQVVINDANGLTNYTNLVSFISSQHQSAMWTDGLRGDILTLAPSDYARLAAQFVNSAGSTGSVLQALLANVAGLNEIRQAREYELNAAELTRLTQLGHPLASFYQGGVFFNGQQRHAMTLHRDDPNVITTVTGMPPQAYDNGMTEGVFSGSVAMSTGGVRAVQPLGFAIAAVT